MVGRVFKDLSLLAVPVLLIMRTETFNMQTSNFELEPLKSILGRTHFSSVLGGFVLEVTSHNFTVQSAEPEARREPSQLQWKTSNITSTSKPESRHLMWGGVKILFYAPEGKGPDA